MVVRRDSEEAETRVIHELIDFGGQDVLRSAAATGA